MHLRGTGLIVGHLHAQQRPATFLIMSGKSAEDDCVEGCRSEVVGGVVVHLSHLGCQHDMHMFANPLTEMEPLQWQQYATTAKEVSWGPVDGGLGPERLEVSSEVDICGFMISFILIALERLQMCRYPIRTFARRALDPLVFSAGVSHR